MISRRNIRVKVMQTLYRIQTYKDRATTASEAQAILNKYFDQTFSLFTWLVHVLIKIAQYAETDARNRSQKHLPTKEDLSVPTKIVENELVLTIQQNPFYLGCLNQFKPYFENDEVIRKIYLQLSQSTPFLTYNIEQSRSKKCEREILEFIFNDLMLANEYFTEWVEYYYTNWDDDAEMLQQLILNFLQKPGNFSFEEMLSKEKRTFANDLLQTTLSRKEQLDEIIKPKLRNWDPDRIALLDMILMEMGVCEFLYFETIPLKVTINEYIDLAKSYSTQQSGQFVNGILDNVKKELEENNLIKKIAYKKA